jgi:hypothetical protein
MSKITKAALALIAVAGLAACAQQPMEEEIVVVEPAPIVAEPVVTKF